MPPPNQQASTESERPAPQRGLNSNRVLGERAAFTMVEILIVLAILGLVLALGAPQILPAFRREPLRRAVSDVVEGLRAARAEAILQAAPAEFVLRATDGQMFVNLVPVDEEDAEDPTHRDRGHELDSPSSIAPSPSRNTAFSARLGDAIKVIFLDVNFVNHMDQEEARVRFSPNGTSDEFTLILDSQAGARKVTLEAVTGIPDVEVIR